MVHRRTDPKEDAAPRRIKRPKTTLPPPTIGSLNRTLSALRLI
jgi:hypothetical protein